MPVTEPYKAEHKQFCQLEKALSGERVQQSGGEDGVRVTAPADAAGGTGGMHGMRMELLEIMIMSLSAEVRD